MNSRFKSNNLFAGLIALVLIAIGFGLSFYNHKSEPIEEPAIAETTAVESESEGIFTEVIPASEKSLSRIALIHTSHDAPSLDKPEKNGTGTDSRLH